MSQLQQIHLAVKQGTASREDFDLLAEILAHLAANRRQAKADDDGHDDDQEEEEEEEEEETDSEATTQFLWCAKIIYDAATTFGEKMVVLAPCYELLAHLLDRCDTAANLSPCEQQQQQQEQRRGTSPPPPAQERAVLHSAIALSESMTAARHLLLSPHVDDDDDDEDEDDDGDDGGSPPRGKNNVSSQNIILLQADFSQHASFLLHWICDLLVSVAVSLTSLNNNNGTSAVSAAAAANEGSTIQPRLRLAAALLSRALSPGLLLQHASSSASSHEIISRALLSSFVDVSSNWLEWYSAKSASHHRKKKKKKKNVSAQEEEEGSSAVPSLKETCHVLSSVLLAYLDRFAQDGGGGAGIEEPEAAVEPKKAMRRGNVHYHSPLDAAAHGLVHQCGILPPQPLSRFQRANRGRVLFEAEERRKMAAAPVARNAVMLPHEPSEDEMIDGIFCEAVQHMQCAARKFEEARALLHRNQQQECCSRRSSAQSSPARSSACVSSPSPLRGTADSVRRPPLPGVPESIVFETFSDVKQKTAEILDCLAQQAKNAQIEHATLQLARDELQRRNEIQRLYKNSNNNQSINQQGGEDPEHLFGNSPSSSNSRSSPKQQQNHQYQPQSQNSNLSPVSRTAWMEYAHHGGDGHSQQQQQQQQHHYNQSPPHPQPHRQPSVQQHHHQYQQDSMHQARCGLLEKQLEDMKLRHAEERREWKEKTEAQEKQLSQVLDQRSQAHFGLPSLKW